MARITVEDCLQQVRNRFSLVHLAARRVIQLRKGAKPLVEAPKNKEIVLALREIAAGKINFETIWQFEQEQLVQEPTPEAIGAPEPISGEEPATPAEEAQASEQEDEAIAAEAAAAADAEPAPPDSGEPEEAEEAETAQ